MTQLVAIVTAILALSAMLYGADAKAGAAAYEKSCKGCHGATGVANPAIAKMLSATIPELSSAEVQSKSDAELVKIITEGKGKMKPIKTLAGPPEDVAAFIHTMKK